VSPQIKGSLPELVRKTVERDVGRYCEDRAPSHLRDKIRIEYEIRGNSVTIVERRPPWREDYGPEWSRVTVAQLRTRMRSGRSIGATEMASGTSTTSSIRLLTSLPR
jgi:hypothetical protein